MENEEEEEEGEGGLEQNCPPNPYQMHPPPEGSCTTDGEMPARLRAEGPRGVTVPASPAGRGPAGPRVPAALATPRGALSLFGQPHRYKRIPIQKLSFLHRPFKNQNIPAEVSVHRVFISALMSRRHLSHLWLFYR